MEPPGQTGGFVPSLVLSGLVFFGFGPFVPLCDGGDSASPHRDQRHGFGPKRWCHCIVVAVAGLGVRLMMARPMTSPSGCRRFRLLSYFAKYVSSLTNLLVSVHVGPPKLGQPPQ